MQLGLIDHAADEALERICRDYWYPLYAFARRSGHSADDAKDLTQGFFATLLDKRYRSQLNRVKQRNSEDAFHTYMNAFTQVYDPHTQYLSPRVSENFDILMKLSLEGIGAVLQRKNEYTRILRLIPAGPAGDRGIAALPRL